MGAIVRTKITVLQAPPGQTDLIGEQLRLYAMIEDQLRSADQPAPGQTAATAATHLAGLLDDEIRRFQQPQGLIWGTTTPVFPRQLEQKFEEDTCRVRVRDLRFTMIFGTVLYYLSAVMDPVFVPDLGWLGVIVRTIGFPLMLGAIVFGPQLRGKVREIVIAGTAVVIITCLAIIPALSAAPLAPYAFTTAILAMIYANTTLVLRFRKACVFTLVSCAIISGLAVNHSGLHDSLGWAISLLTVVGGLFSLVSNYRIERSARLSYLLGTREIMRSQALAADREMLKTLSNTDELTGLANRNALKRWCANALTSTQNQGRNAALLMIDVDHFKRYNDFYGHMAGDVCLRTIAQKISKTVRSDDDIVARFGGEEFVVLLLDVDPRRAWALAERICSAIEDLSLPHANRSDGSRTVTISIGVATSTIGAGCTLESLMRTADRGLYIAKRKGRNRVETAMPSAA